MFYCACCWIGSDSYEWFDAPHLPVDIPLPLSRICFDDHVQAWRSFKAFLLIKLSECLPIWRPSWKVNVYYTFYSLSTFRSRQGVMSWTNTRLKSPCLTRVWKYRQCSSDRENCNRHQCCSAIFFTISRERSLPLLGPPAAIFLSCHRKMTTPHNPITFHPHSRNLECKSVGLIQVRYQRRYGEAGSHLWMSHL